MLNSNLKLLCLSGCLLISTNSHVAIANDMMAGVKLSASQQASMGMQTDIAKQTNLIPSAIYPAQATIPLKTIRSLSSPLAGQIIKLNYVHGPVKQGEVIAEIESPELLKIQEGFLAAVSDLKVSKQNLNRTVKLNKSGMSSTKKLQQANAEVKKNVLNKSQHKKSLELIGMSAEAIQKLEKTEQIQPAVFEIKSPIDGQLFDLEVRLGERVSKNQSLISLGETNPIILVVRVPVESAHDINEGQKVEIETFKRMGTVKHIDPMVDPMTQSVDIHIGVQNDDNRLRSGQLFKIRFMTEKSQTVFQTSANAISQYNDKTVVFIKSEQAIKPLVIEVVNISNGQLYFVPETRQSLPLTIFVTGSTAIKSALAAGIESSEE